MEKYKFMKYNPNFKKLYQKERLKLNRILFNVEIEYVGSTAVPGLGGKGIIDIIIATPKKEINKIKNKLIKSGYNFKQNAGEKGRLFFERDYKDKNKIRRVHIHLTSKNSEIWKNHIAVRNYLREHKEELNKYANIKKQAVKICKGEGKKYRDYKKNYLTQLTEKALKKKLNKEKK